MMRLVLVLLLALPLAACGVDGAPQRSGAAAALPAGVGPEFSR